MKRKLSTQTSARKKQKRDESLLEKLLFTVGPNTNFFACLETKEVFELSEIFSIHNQVPELHLDSKTLWKWYAQPEWKRLTTLHFKDVVLNQDLPAMPALHSVQLEDCRGSLLLPFKHVTLVGSTRMDLLWNELESLEFRHSYNSIPERLLQKCTALRKLVAPNVTHFVSHSPLLEDLELDMRQCPTISLQQEKQLRRLVVSGAVQVTDLCTDHLEELLLLRQANLKSWTSSLFHLTSLRIAWHHVAEHVVFPNLEQLTLEMWEQDQTVLVLESTFPRLQDCTLHYYNSGELETVLVGVLLKTCTFALKQKEQDMLEHWHRQKLVVQCPMVVLEQVQVQFPLYWMVQTPWKDVQAQRNTKLSTWLQEQFRPLDQRASKLIRALAKDKDRVGLLRKRFQEQIKILRAQFQQMTVLDDQGTQDHARALELEKQVQCGNDAKLYDFCIKEYKRLVSIAKDWKVDELKPTFESLDTLERELWQVVRFDMQELCEEHAPRTLQAATKTHQQMKRVIVELSKAIKANTTTLDLNKWRAVEQKWIRLENEWKKTKQARFTRTRSMLAKHLSWYRVRLQKLWQNTVWYSLQMSKAVQVLQWYVDFSSGSTELLHRTNI